MMKPHENWSGSIILLLMKCKFLVSLKIEIFVLKCVLCHSMTWLDTLGHPTSDKKSDPAREQDCIQF
jgi:hypothetical protein